MAFGLTGLLTVGACAFPPPLPFDLPETYTAHRRPVENATDFIAKADWVNAEPVSLVMAEYSLTPRELVLNEGRAYRLVLLNLGDKMHAMNAPQFYRAIAVQKVEVSRGDYKAFPHAHRDTSSTVFETSRRLQRLTVEEIEAPPPLTGESPDEDPEEEGKDEEPGAGDSKDTASPATAPAKGASPAVKAAPQTPVGRTPAPAPAKNGGNGDSASGNGDSASGSGAKAPGNGGKAPGDGGPAPGKRAGAKAANGVSGAAANGASDALASAVEAEIEDDAPTLPGTPAPAKVATPRPKLSGEGREVEDTEDVAQEPHGVEDDDTIGPRRLPRFKAKAPEPTLPAVPAPKPETIAQPAAPAADDLSEAPVVDDLAEDVKPSDPPPATASPATAAPPPTAAETRPVQEKPVVGAAQTEDRAPPKPVAGEPGKAAPKAPAAKSEPKASPTERGLARERPASVEGAAPTLGGEGDELVEELSEKEFATLVRTGLIEVPAGRAKTVYFVAVRKGR
ncbi:MAG: hypothetical protein FJX61_05300 [Alphaproteobacteria bacterium]|nr:hypothetical protein [Alphaproteobacteria bacterium]